MASAAPPQTDQVTPPVSGGAAPAGDWRLAAGARANCVPRQRDPLRGYPARPASRVPCATRFAGTPPRASHLAFLAFLAAASALIAGGAALSAGQDPPRPRPLSKADPRTRWEALPLEKRQALERMYEQLKTLPPAERDRLLERLRSMEPAQRKEILKRLRSDLSKDPAERKLELEDRRLVRRRIDRLPTEERDRLRSLAPEERKRYLEQKAADRLEKVLAELPPATRERVESLASLKEKWELVHRLRSERLFRRVFHQPGEVDGLRRLPRRQVVERLLWREREGNGGTPPPRPEFLSEETWRRWLELKPFQRPGVLRHLLGPPRSRQGTVEGL